MNAIVSRYGCTLRIYDNRGRTADRFTLIPPRWATDYRAASGLWDCFGASARPFHPQGFGQICNAVPGPHLGARVRWADLPADVQRAARQTFPEFCP